MFNLYEEQLDEANQEIESLRTKILKLESEIENLQRDLIQAEKSAREYYNEGYYNGKYEEQKGYPEW